MDDSLHGTMHGAVEALLDEELAGADRVHGSALGSFACEEFSVDRLKTLDSTDVAERVEEFRRLTSFEATVVEEQHV